jgi:hypothetical protein
MELTRDNVQTTARGRLCPEENMKNWLHSSRAVLVACVIGLFFISAAAQAATPTVAITSPANNLRTTNNNLTVRGTATSRDTNDPIGSVTVIVNGNAQTANGTNSWDAPVTLQPGDNVITAQSVTVGNVQSVSVTRHVTLNVFTTVTVTTNGNGTVTPNINGRQQLVGSTVRLRATPAPDWSFSGWTGSTNSTNNNLTFTVTDGAALTANFAPNPLQKARGVYNGLIFDTNNINGNTSGSFNLMVNKPDTYVLKITVAGNTGTATGKLDSNGAADFSTRGRNPITGHIQVDTSGTTHQVTGEVTSPVTASMTGDLNVFGGTNLCPFAGQYNLIIGTNDVVQGLGYANVFVDGSGNVKVNGVLADGTPISQSTTISSNGVWPLFVKPYGNNFGAFMGWMVVANIPQSSLHGVSYWFHPELSRGIFKGEFSRRQDVVGSLFIQPPPHVSIMKWTDGIATIGGDDLPSPLVSHLTWNSNNLINVDFNDFTFQVTSFGNIKGSLSVPVSHRRDTLQGTILPKTNWAGGFFLDTNSSGFFTINEDLSAGTNILVQAPGDISSFTGHPAVLTLTLDKKTGFFANANTMTFDFGETGTTTVTSSDIANFGTANYNYSSYVSTSANIAELNIIGGTLRGHQVVIRMLLHFTDSAGQNGDFIATITAGGSGTATGTFTLP